MVRLTRAAHYGATARGGVVFCPCARGQAAMSQHPEPALYLPDIGCRRWGGSGCDSGVVSDAALARGLYGEDAEPARLANP